MTLIYVAYLFLIIPLVRVNEYVGREKPLISPWNRVKSNDIVNASPALATHVSARWMPCHR